MQGCAPADTQTPTSRNFWLGFVREIQRPVCVVLWQRSQAPGRPFKLGAWREMKHWKQLPTGREWDQLIRESNIQIHLHLVLMLTRWGCSSQGRWGGHHCGSCVLQQASGWGEGQAKTQPDRADFSCRVGWGDRSWWRWGRGTWNRVKGWQSRERKKLTSGRFTATVFQFSFSLSSFFW